MQLFSDIALRRLMRAVSLSSEQIDEIFNDPAKLQQCRQAVLATLAGTMVVPRNYRRVAAEPRTSSTAATDQEPQDESDTVQDDDTDDSNNATLVSLFDRISFGDRA